MSITCQRKQELSQQVHNFVQTLGGNSLSGWDLNYVRFALEQNIQLVKLSKKQAKAKARAQAAKSKLQARKVEELASLPNRLLINKLTLNTHDIILTKNILRSGYLAQVVDVKHNKVAIKSMRYQDLDAISRCRNSSAARHRLVSNVYDKKNFLAMDQSRVIVVDEYFSYVKHVKLENITHVLNGKVWMEL